MRRDIEPIVDPERCTLCGNCVDVCASDLLEMGEEGPEATGYGPCFVCGHCIAVCPADAIKLPNTEPSALVELMPRESAADVECVWDLLRRRRSIRNYTDEQVPEDVVMELIEAAALAPSALNEQGWHFSVIRDPDHLQRIRRRIVAIYHSLLKMLDGRFNRMMLRLMLGTEAADMLMDTQPQVQRLVTAYEQGEDHILWSAPTLIVVHSPGEEATSTESSHYAVGNMMTMATAMGLGTCLIGFVTEVAARDDRLKSYLRVPEDHSIDAALVVGYPDVDYLRSVQRREPPVEFV